MRGRRRRPSVYAARTRNSSAAGRGIIPYLALLRKGFALRQALRRCPAGSYPAFSPLLRDTCAPRSGMFSVALSFPQNMVRGIPGRSRARDFPPCGVRTFLPPPRSEERPPATAGSNNTSPRAIGKLINGGRPPKIHFSTYLHLSSSLAGFPRYIISPEYLFTYF